MESILSGTYEVHMADLAKAALQQHMNTRDYSKVFVLVDENTERLCLPKMMPIFEPFVSAVLTISSGEENKNITSCLRLWEALSQKGADRKSLLINLGGGVLTDMGGFIASTFKRGIDFINIPSTLLAMVDASIGGKTGVDLGSLKNQIGVINQPQMVLVLPELLDTLEERQLVSGYAEMLKHGLIQNETYWDHLKITERFSDPAHIQTSIAIKNEVVLQDPTEQNLRKILNFGHTLGHAIESYCLDNPKKETLLHGEAIAVGMILEAFLSHELKGLSKVAVNEIKATFLKHFPKVGFGPEDIEIIIDLMKYDKKNSHGDVNFVLLQSIGEAVIDVRVPEDLIPKAFAYYNE
ncbi:MAG: 3-dehydroquinate synthase [Bacteroidota bacterium]